jgi:hypothetical protein
MIWMILTCPSSAGNALVNSVFLTELAVLIDFGYTFNANISVTNKVNTRFAEILSSTFGTSETLSLFKRLTTIQAPANSNISSKGSFCVIYKTEDRTTMRTSIFV